MGAMAIFGLTIPGSALQYATSNVAFGIIAGCLAVGGAVKMAILAPFLGRPNRARGDRLLSAMNVPSGL